MIALVMESYYLSEQGDYILGSTEEWDISQKHYENYVSSIEYYRSLGGTELLEEHSQGATLTSVSPDKRNKTVRTFYY